MIRSFKILMSYFFKQYLRSNKYVAPFVVYAICLVAAYGQRPVYVMTSYLFTSVFIYFFAAWLTFNFNNSEQPVQQQLNILHIKKENYYYICKVLFILMIIIVVSVITVFFPIVGHFFIRRVYALEIVAAILSHVVIGLLGISTAVLFDERLIKSGRSRFLYLASILIVSIIVIPISVHYSFIKWIMIIFPPSYLIINRLGSIDVMSLGSFYKLMWDLIIVILYSIVLIYIYLKLMRKNRF